MFDKRLGRYVNETEEEKADFRKRCCRECYKKNNGICKRTKTKKTNAGCGVDIIEKESDK